MRFVIVRSLLVLTLLTLMSLSTNSVLAASDEAVAELDLKTLEGLRAEIRRVQEMPGGKGADVETSDQPIFWAGKCHVATTNYYSSEGKRYLAVHLTVGNPTQQPLTLLRQNIVAEINGVSSPPAHGDTDYNGPLRIEGDLLSKNVLETPAKVIIEPGGVKTFWCRYFDFPVLPRVPKIVLSIMFEEQGMFEVDLNNMQQDRLGLASTLIGPKECLAHLKIHGSLNTLNAADLTAFVTESHLDGTERFLIEWMPNAPEFDVQLLDWLLNSQSAEERNNVLFRQMPALPEVRLITCVNVPKPVAEAIDAQEYQLSDSLESAVHYSLEDVFIRLNQEQLLKEIRSSDPLIVQTALKAAGDRLNASAFNLLKQLSQSENLAVRAGAYHALAYQSEAAQALLFDAVHSDNPVDSRAAFRALLQANSLMAERGVLGILEQPIPHLSRVEKLKELQRHYRPAWNVFIAESIDDQSVEVRQTAYRVLSEVGHPKIVQLLEQGLEDDSEAVRNHVFFVLTERDDPPSVSLAMNYAMAQLKACRITQTIINLLQTTSDPRSAPLLYALLEKETDYQQQIIQLLSKVGDNQIAQDLRSDWSKFEEDSKVSILNMFKTHNFDGSMELAKAAIESDSNTLQYAAIELLQQENSDEAAAILASQIDLEDEQLFRAICISLGTNASQRAIEEMKKLRSLVLEKGDKQQIIQVRMGFEALEKRSPANSAMETGDNYFRVNEYANAKKYYELAARIDPKLSTVWSNLGMIHFRLDDHDASLAAYQKAYDLNHFDGQAVTGVGILLSIKGKWRAGIEITETAAKNFIYDDTFAYNTACVYGRALEAIAKEGAVDKQIVEDIREKAITALRQSIDEGFEQFDLMRTDPDLDTLRDHPEFNELYSSVE